MADGTAIEWTDATWNPVTGCSVVSPGCTNCYAMKLAGTRLKHTPSRSGLTVASKAGPVWNGKVRFNREWIHQPIDWKRPRRIFVCAHGDLFAENVPDEWIIEVFTVMAIAGHHDFQVLTKRPDRACEFLSKPFRLDDIYANWYTYTGKPAEVWSWPLHNVWIGASAEDQIRYDQRRQWLDETPAAKRFWSLEPLLGPVEMKIQFVKPDWIIVGGESGKDARPMHPAWPRSIRDQCADTGVPFFFKQWGHWACIDQSPAADEAGWQGRGNWMILDKDGDLDIPDHRWPDEEAGVCAVIDVGKKRAGRLLDGIEHNAFPERTTP
jgi:protein gp37